MLQIGIYFCNRCIGLLLFLYLQVDFTLRIEEISFIRQRFIKRMDKEYYTPDTQKFAESRVEDYPKQVYNCFQRFKLCYFGRSKTHQDDIKVVDKKVCINIHNFFSWMI